MPQPETGSAEEAMDHLVTSILQNYRKGEAGAQAVQALTTQISQGEAGKPVSGDTDLVEVAFRSALAEIVKQSLTSASPSSSSRRQHQQQQQNADILDEDKFALRALLDLALYIATQTQKGKTAAPQAGGGLGRRSVFFLLEDIFDLLGVEQIQAFWPEVEAREEALFGLFQVAQKSKLTMLKLTNALLRRLSKAHNTAICGRIMMYLSRNWDLSEPSAINRGGHANQGNKTVYEDSDEFERQQERLAEKKRRDEELRMAVVAGAAALQKQQEGGKGGKEGEKEKEQPIDYSLYQTFWGLQEHLADPAGVGKSEEAWGEFVSKAKVVLQAFEGFTVSEESAASAAAKAMGKQKEKGQKEEEKKEKEGQEKEGGEGGEGEGDGEKEGGEGEGEGEGEGQEREKQEEEEEEEEPERREEEDEDDDDESKGPSKKRSRKSVAPREGNNNSMTSTNKSSSDTNMEAYLGCKYLTNSRLFRLQLHDPLVRVQVLTQLLIFLNHASASAALTATTTPPTPTSPAGTSKTSSSTTTTTHTQKPGANDLAKHARRLIRSTPPHGNVYLTTLDTVLDREKSWIAWKQLDKCSSKIEKTRAPPAKQTRMKDSVKKALLVAEKPTLTVSQQTKTFYGKALPLPRPVDMKAIEIEVGKMGGESRTFANYIVPRMEEVNDPDACIDEEYHPRHEPVFVWRALRLAAVEETKVMVDLESGGLDGLCGRVMGWPVQVEVEKKEEEEEGGVKKEEDMEVGGEGEGEGGGVVGMEVEEGEGGGKGKVEEE